MPRKFHACLLALVSSVLAFSAPAKAANVHTLFSGKIKYVYLSSPTNMAYRVTLDVNLPDCLYNFAYISPSDGNYDAYASLLTAAAAGNRSINIWITTDANGFCHMDELQVPF